MVGLPLQLARERSDRISEVAYDITFEIPDSHLEPVNGVVLVSFNLHDNSKGLALDFKAPFGSVRSVEIGKREIPFRHRGGQIVIPQTFLSSGRDSIRITFQAVDTALNRHGEYLYTLFVPDRASTAFPCFDQPDLKARFRLKLVLPEHWAAVANARQLDSSLRRGRKVVQFDLTEPISTYLFAFAAGDFKTEVDSQGKRTIRMFHRDSDVSRVERNRQRIFALHRSAVDWLEEYTGIAYPFSKLDFVLLPSFQFGGMEHPGSIFYRAETLFLDESATQTQKLAQASLIAHEVAHMWFGDLVTMKWFSDVWMKEVFANFMAARIINPAFPEINHELRFLLSHHPAAYAVDRSGGTHPVRQELDNLDDAAGLYGAIIYQKAPILMRQLEGLIGEDCFREGLRRYLISFAWNNADWLDLVDILDELSEDDLESWSRTWVEGAGMPRIEVLTDRDDQEAILSVKLVQSDPLGRSRLWPQLFHVVAGDGKWLESRHVLLKEAETKSIQFSQTGRALYVIPNGRGTGYGLFLLDPSTVQWLLDRLPSITDPLLRAAAWISLWDALLEGRVEAEEFLDLVKEAVPAESNELLTEAILGYMNRVYWKFSSAQERQRKTNQLEELLWEQLQAAQTATLKATFFRAFQGLATSREAVEKLRQIWNQETVLEGLVLGERDRSTLAFELAVRGVDDTEALLKQHLSGIEDPERRERFEFVMPALSRNSEVRKSFFYSLRDEEMRQNEPWVLEALHYIHHPLRVSDSVSYLRESLDMLEEVRRTGTIFFPKKWLDENLWGHRSEEAVEIVKTFLAERPELAPRLKAKVLQAADELFRAVQLSGSDE